MPHTFRQLFGGTADLAMHDLVEPAHRQSVGLVLSDRDPLPPMAAALFRVVLDADFEGALAHSTGSP